MNAIKCSLAGCAVFAFMAVVMMGLFALLTAGNKNNSAEPPPQVQNGALDAANSGQTTSNGSGGNNPVLPNNQNPVCQALYQRLTAQHLDVQIFNEAAQQWGVPAHRLIAQAEAESNFSPTAVSPVGAQGMMQFMPDTWREQTGGASNVSPFNPRDATWYGAKYMRGHYDNNNQNWDLALAAYNAGQGNVDTYHGIPPFAETQNYITRINELANKYQQCSQSSSVSGGDASTGHRTQLARQISGHRRINLLARHVSTVPGKIK